MSLLLDVLKKSADDKNNHEENLDLELSLNTTTETEETLAETEDEPLNDKQQDLLALINKSNHDSRQQRLKTNITLGILIGLILVGSGLYFFIEMKVAQQGIYLIQKNTPTTQNILSQENVALIKTQSMAINTAPKTVINKPQSHTIKSTIKKTAIKKPTNTNNIHIIRSKKTNPLDSILLNAYREFHKQNYTAANNLYKKALKHEPKNRDVLLGLAAVATKQQRYEYARQKYQYLLKLKPRDSLAIAGISSLENKLEPQLTESQLKFMLKQQPDAAHLYFALGAHYATQKKWPEAQSAFFHAWSAKNKNADYCYNLAISLDHLEKKKQALDFYKLSLKLKQTYSGNFSQVDTENRMHRLQANIQ